MRVIGVAGKQCRKCINLAVIEVVTEAVVELLQRELSLNPGRDVQSIAPLIPVYVSAVSSAMYIRRS